MASLQLSNDPGRYLETDLGVDRSGNLLVGSATTRVWLSGDPWCWLADGCVGQHL